MLMHHSLEILKQNHVIILEDTSNTTYPVLGTMLSTLHAHLSWIPQGACAH